MLLGLLVGLSLPPDYEPLEDNDWVIVISVLQTMAHAYRKKSTLDFSNRTLSQVGASKLPSHHASLMGELIKVLGQEPAPCLVAPACGACFASVGLAKLSFSSMRGNFHTFFRLSFMIHSIAMSKDF